MNSDRDIQQPNKNKKNFNLSHKKSFSVNVNSQLTQFFNEIEKGGHDKKSIASKNSSNFDGSNKEDSNPSQIKSSDTGTDDRKISNNKTASHEEGIGSLDSRKKKFINPIILNNPLNNNSEDDENEQIHHKNFESFSHIKPSKSQMKQFDSFFKHNKNENISANSMNDKSNTILDNEQMLQNVFKSTLESKSSYQGTQSFNNFDTNTSSKKQLQEELIEIQKKLSKQINLERKNWYQVQFNMESNETSIYDVLARGIDDINNVSDIKIQTFLADMKNNFKKHWNYMKFLGKEPNQILLLKTRKSLVGGCIYNSYIEYYIN